MLIKNINTTVYSNTTYIDITIENAYLPFFSLSISKIFKLMNDILFFVDK